MAPPIGKKQLKLNALMFAMMLEELLSGPCTAKSLAEHTGLSLITVHRTLRALYRRNVVHIASWENDAANRCNVRVFGLGHGRDARKPVKTKAQSNKAYRLKAARRPLAEMGAMAC